MKNVLVLFFLMVSMMNAHAVDDLVGMSSPAEIEAKGYPWWTKGMNSPFKITPAQRKSLVEGMRGKRVKVFFGTWCSDSHRHLPTFARVLKESGIPDASVGWYALDTKKSYPGFENAEGIEYIPTFVIYEKGREIGRIIEKPQASILEDTLRILRRPSRTKSPASNR